MHQLSTFVFWGTFIKLKSSLNNPLLSPSSPVQYNRIGRRYTTNIKILFFMWFNRDNISVQLRCFEAASWGIAGNHRSDVYSQ